MNKRFVFVVFCTALMASSCFPVRVTQVRGSGNLKTDTRRVSNFNSVQLSGVGTLVITQGDREGLEITADDNILAYVESNVFGRNLNLGVQDFINIQPSANIVYQLTVRELENIETSGVGQVDLKEFSGEDLTIAISGSGSVDISDLAAESLEMKVSGMGDVQISGAVKDQRVEISGAGDYDASDLESETAQVEISGVGSAQVWATRSLDVELSGMGNVFYYGDPSVATETSGAGSIEALGEK